jgi:hypothetical protein
MLTSLHAEENGMTSEWSGDDRTLNEIQVGEDKSDLPAPFGPITPTIPALGKLNSRLSIKRRSPKAFLTP